MLLHNLKMQKPIRHSICTVVLLLFVISSNSFELNTTQELRFGSVANLSTSWVNNPSLVLFINSTQAPEFSIAPILFSSSNHSKFLCGFYCPYQGPPKMCLFGILIFQSFYYDKRQMYHVINEPQLVWSANPDYPVKINATMNFNENGDLNLKDADGTLVWSTGTRDKNVSQLTLTEVGNLVLRNNTNASFWQSFDHPTDTLLPHQILAPGQELTSRTSASNWSSGSYSLTVENNLLSAYLKSNPSQKYFESSFLEVIDYARFERKGFKIFTKTGFSPARFMRLEPNGHLLVYEWGVPNFNAWGVSRDVFPIEKCGYPLVCGNYGMCSDGQCSCPENSLTAVTSLRPINRMRPDLGCSLEKSISCHSNRSHSLSELKGITYFNSNQDFYDETNMPGVDEKTRLENCMNNCLKYCSCKAAIFVHDSSNSTKRGCLLLSEVFSLRDNEGGGSEKVSFFLKVEKSQNISYPIVIPNPPKKSSRRMRIIMGSTVGVSLAALCLLALCGILYKRKYKKEGKYEEFCVDQVSGVPLRFSYQKMKAITNNFSLKLGQGGFGSVYEGILDGTKVAVKCLNGLGHMKDSFLAEVETIGSVHHMNLVGLIGFCAEKSHRLLVYEYMYNGSLDQWIFQRQEEFILGWEVRRRIVLDIAKGLAYLHEECRKKIYHLDIKPQNILLDEDFTAKVSDFGLAMLIDKNQTQVMTTLRGTPGYLAPEWLSSIITEKVDVYSFGIVVLEIVCGRNIIDRSKTQEEMLLLNLFKEKAVEGKLEEIVDKRNADMTFHTMEVVEMMKVVMLCIQNDFTKRPSMSMVVKVLEGLVNLEDLDNSFGSDRVMSNSLPSCLESAIGSASEFLPSILSGPR